MRSAHAHTKYIVLQFSELLSGTMLNLRCNLRLHDVLRHSGYSLLSLFHTVCLAPQYISHNHCLVGERMHCLLLELKLRTRWDNLEIIFLIFSGETVILLFLFKPMSVCVFSHVKPSPYIIHNLYSSTIFTLVVVFDLPCFCINFQMF